MKRYKPQLVYKMFGNALCFFGETKFKISFLNLVAVLTRSERRNCRRLLSENVFVCFEEDRIKKKLLETKKKNKITLKIRKRTTQKGNKFSGEG